MWGGLVHLWRLSIRAGRGVLAAGAPEERALCVHERDVDSGLGGQDPGARKAAQPGGPGKACSRPTQALPRLPAISVVSFPRFEAWVHPLIWKFARCFIGLKHGWGTALRSRWSPTSVSGTCGRSLSLQRCVARNTHIVSLGQRCVLFLVVYAVPTPGLAQMRPP